MYIISVSGLVDLCSEQVVGESSIAQMQNYQGGLQHFVIGGGGGGARIAWTHAPCMYTPHVLKCRTKVCSSCKVIKSCASYLSFICEVFVCVGRCNYSISAQSLSMTKNAAYQLGSVGGGSCPPLQNYASKKCDPVVKNPMTCMWQPLRFVAASCSSMREVMLLTTSCVDLIHTLIPGI